MNQKVSIAGNSCNLTHDIDFPNSTFYLSPFLEVLVPVKVLFYLNVLQISVYVKHGG